MLKRKYNSPLRTDKVANSTVTMPFERKFDKIRREMKTGVGHSE